MRLVCLFQKPPICIDWISLGSFKIPHKKQYSMLAEMQLEQRKEFLGVRIRKRHPVRVLPQRSKIIFCTGISVIYSIWVAYHSVVHFLSLALPQH
jgi:hypothetical protein